MPAVAKQSRNLVLAAMIFAVAMTFIDQTIVSIAAPNIQRELHLTSTGMQWAINSYLLALAALFAFGGRLADTVGHTKMVVIGVIVFAGASAMCGLTPVGIDLRGLDRHLPGHPGSGRRAHVPRCARDRGADLSPARTWKGSGTLLRDRRRSDRGGSDPRRLPDRVDLAGHLLGQHPGGCDRARPDRDLAAEDRVQVGTDRLPRDSP